MVSLVPGADYIGYSKWLCFICRFASTIIFYLFHFAESDGVSNLTKEGTVSCSSLLLILLH